MSSRIIEVKQPKEKVSAKTKMTGGKRLQLRINKCNDSPAIKNKKKIEIKNHLSTID